MWLRREEHCQLSYASLSNIRCDQILDMLKMWISGGVDEILYYLPGTVAHVGNTKMFSLKYIFKRFCISHYGCADFIMVE